MSKQSWIAAAASALVLAVACALAWWAYQLHQQRELQQKVLVLARDATIRLRGALELLSAEADARAELDAHFTAVEGDVRAVQRLDASSDPELVHAANAYVTDVEALLRRAVALHAGRDAVRADMGAIGQHLSAAGERSPQWISQALALNKQLERSFFDLRLVAGGLDKSLDSLRSTGPALQTRAPAAVVVEADEIVAAKRRVVELAAQIEQQVKNAQKLPAG